MTKNIGGFAGFSVLGGGSGGVFNFLTQYVLKKQNLWEKTNAVGGTESTPGNGYKYHFFTSSGSLRVYNGGPVEYIVVAGGGSGVQGASFTDTTGGGGGAGGYRTGSVRLFEGQYNIIIGSGGSIGLVPNGLIPSVLQGNGSPSVFEIVGSSAESSSVPSLSSFYIRIESTGGGRGGAYNPFTSSGTNALPGGSGGGSAFPGASAGSGNSPPTTPPQGNGGGGITGPSGWLGGGGGGAGGAGGTAQGTAPPFISGARNAGSGGLGVSGFNADPGIPPSYGAPGPSPGRWFAGGGGGGAGSPSGLYLLGFGGGSGPGPFAGGGPGGQCSTGLKPGISGTANTGGGGGGGSATAPLVSPTFAGGGGNGGSGIVIIRYLL